MSTNNLDNKEEENANCSKRKYVNDCSENLENIGIKRLHSNWSHSAPDPHSDLIFCFHLSFLSDQVYKTFIETKVSSYDGALSLSKNNTQISMLDLESNISLSEVTKGLVEFVHNTVHNETKFANQIPLLTNKITKNDLKTILNNGLFYYGLLRHGSLAIGNQSFLMFSNGVYFTRKLMNSMYGKLMTDIIFNVVNDFNQLELTQREISLMIPYMLTMSGQKGIEQPNHLAELNELYFKALSYEFDLNLRKKSFITKWKKVVDSMPYANEMHFKYVRNLELEFS